MGLSIPKTQCKTGKLNPRPEFHGNETHNALDVSVEEIALDKEQLNEMLDDPDAHRSLYRTKGSLCEPRFAGMITVDLPVEGTWEKSGCNLYVGPELEKIAFGSVKICKVRLTRTTGGITMMACQVQTNADPEQVAQLYTHMSEDASISLRFGKIEVKAVKPQPELPLGSKPDDKGPGDDDHVPGPLETGGAAA